MNLGKTIKTYREEAGMTQIELGEKTGISRASIQLYEKDKVKIPFENLKKITNALKINLTDLYAYEISVSDDKFLSPSPSNLKEKNLFTNEDKIYITQLSSKVGAGESVDISGIEIFDTKTLIAFSENLFKTPPKPDRLRCMQVVGYSMVPMLFPDSWVVLEVGVPFDDDGLYVIDMDGSFMVKLVQKCPDGSLDIISKNPEYRSYHIGRDDESFVRIVGKVLRCII